ncbi:MAG: hypothetical protein A2252_02800 [Elusimicrobia bacterium RIFOXYA2_FULL_39_19]|nr:MAG: hypothetical protein A2252_02800 [Elusimicrobia bacterium RIFOXYA2_FULL_39_19]
MKNSLILLLLFCSCAQALDFSGNAEYLYTSIEKKETLLNPGNLLSIPPNTHLGEIKTGFSAQTKYKITIDARARYDSMLEKSEGLLDQAYIILEPADYLKFKLGRQKIGFGVGYLWNPVNDLDIKKDAYNPEKYSQGIDVLRFTHDFTSFLDRPFSFNFEFIPPTETQEINNLQYARTGAQFYLLTNDIELGLLGSYKKNLNYSDNSLIGVYTSVDIGGMILGMEYAQANKPELVYFTNTGLTNKIGWETQAIVNLNRRITEKSFIMLEYFYNGFGYDETDFSNMLNLINSSYALYAPVALGTLNPGYLSKNYIFCTLSYDLTDNLGFSFSTLGNLDRPGGFVYPQFSWTKLKNTTISLEGISNISSDKQSEFSLSPYSSMLLLRTQYFF